MKFSQEYWINANDTDLNGIVSAGAVLRYMQDAANWQMEKQGPSFDALWENGYSFVLSRIALSIYAPMRSHELITAQSWAIASKGYIYQRCYRIVRGDDIVAEASSAWALLGKEDRKPRRVGEVPLNYSEDDPLELDMPLRFRVPQEIQMNLVGERVIGYSDVDRNGHLNNTRYPDLYCSYLPDMRHKRVISFSVSFLSEAPLGESVKVYLGSDDETYYFRSVLPSGKVNAEAEFLLEPV